MANEQWSLPTLLLLPLRVTLLWLLTSVLLVPRCSVEIGIGRWGSMIRWHDDGMICDGWIHVWGESTAWQYIYALYSSQFWCKVLGIFLLDRVRVCSIITLWDDISVWHVRQLGVETDFITVMSQHHNQQHLKCVCLGEPIFDFPSIIRHSQGFALRVKRDITHVWSNSPILDGGQQPQNVLYRVSITRRVRHFSKCFEGYVSVQISALKAHRTVSWHKQSM
jgi:hypothetical protein